MTDQEATQLVEMAAVPNATDSFIEAIAAANEAERLAAELDRRGGGLTAHAAALARQRAERQRRETEFSLTQHIMDAGERHENDCSIGGEV